jgi:hypothetical protein
MKKKEKEGVVVTDTTLWRWQENIASVWKVPRQCSLVLMIWEYNNFFNMPMEGPGGYIRAKF